jgi:hypothetical protein
MFCKPVHFPGCQNVEKGLKNKNKKIAENLKKNG